MSSPVPLLLCNRVPNQTSSMVIQKCWGLMAGSLHSFCRVAACHQPSLTPTAFGGGKWQRHRWPRGAAHRGAHLINGLPSMQAHSQMSVRGRRGVPSAPEAYESGPSVGRPLVATDAQAPGALYVGHDGTTVVGLDDGLLLLLLLLQHVSCLLMPYPLCRCAISGSFWTRQSSDDCHSLVC